MTFLLEDYPFCIKIGYKKIIKQKNSKNNLEIRLSLTFFMDNDDYYYLILDIIPRGFENKSLYYRFDQIGELVIFIKKYLI
jgi:hypothetical protein